MELRYLVGRYLGKRILFVITAQEESHVRQQLQTTSCHIFFSGKWNEGGLSERRYRRWFSKIHRWIVTAQLVDSEMLTELICNAHVVGKRVEDLETFLLEVEPMIPATPQQMIHMLTTKGVPKTLLTNLYCSFRYALEPVIALAVLIAISPVFLLVALAVKMTSPGPVFYSQKRVGYKGRLFDIYKFRSMLDNAENGVAQWASASKSDSKLTPIGAFLRSSHLDELPQFWNIVRGDVSFIGPRPERPEFVSQLTERFPLFRLRPLVKPGITGWAQVHQGYANSINDSLRKLELDLFYIIRFSIWLDLKIVVKTIAILFMGGTEGLKRSRSARLLPIE